MFLHTYLSTGLTLFSFFLYFLTWLSGKKSVFTYLFVYGRNAFFLHTYLSTALTLFFFLYLAVRKTYLFILYLAVRKTYLFVYGPNAFFSNAFFFLSLLTWLSGKHTYLSTGVTLFYTYLSTGLTLFSFFLYLLAVRKTYLFVYGRNAFFTYFIYLLSKL